MSSASPVRDRLGPFDAWRRAPAWLAHPVLVVGLAASWAVVHLGGGTRSALPHVFYVVILAAAGRFGTAGGVVYGVLATVVAGPLLPVDAATGEAQAAVNWLSRGVFLVVAGGVAGGSLDTLARTYRSQLGARLEHDLTLPSDGTPVGPDGGSSRTRIEAVLAGRTYHVLFQPIYSLGDGGLVAVEALARFDAGPRRAPNVWFDEAAEAGLGSELELALLEDAFVHSEGLPDGVALSINCSPATFGDPRLVDLLDRHPRRGLIVELTEHAIVEDYKPVDVALRTLRGRGVQVAIDDAGAGFASLRHIVRLSPEIIKLDISLTQDLRDDPVRWALADALIRFARQTGSTLVAEGIEHASDLATWVDLGADAAQGYHLGRPGPLPAPRTCPRIQPYVRGTSQVRSMASPR